ncbi:unnamed protein product [Prorocentrum cordatum]|uniref:Uncharacterized protein n=1 Tax=Prorocentrum cordatum TaxID=2364126 RepID=A0ABN9T188_9DINO|nr:unnamed protein product [Polarella glacialis]
MRPSPAARGIRPPDPVALPRASHVLCRSGRRQSLFRRPVCSRRWVDFVMQRRSRPPEWGWSGWGVADVSARQLDFLRADGGGASVLFSEAAEALIVEGPRAFLRFTLDPHVGDSPAAPGTLRAPGKECPGPTQNICADLRTFMFMAALFLLNAQLRSQMGLWQVHEGRSLTL